MIRSIHKDISAIRKIVVRKFRLKFDKSSRLTWMNAEGYAGVVEILLQLLDGQTKDRLELFASEVAHALAGFHVLDVAGADAAEIDGSQIVLPLEAGIPQHLPQQLMVALLTVLEELFFLSQWIR